MLYTERKYNHKLTQCEKLWIEVLHRAVMDLLEGPRKGYMLTEPGRFFFNENPNYFLFKYLCKEFDYDYKTIREKLKKLMRMSHKERNKLLRNRNFRRPYVK